MKVYISGPMTGIKDFNRPAFFAKEMTLRGMGHVVLNPARVGSDTGKWEDNMRSSLYLLLQAQAITFLDGWEQSRGARLEASIACELGMEVI